MLSCVDCTRHEKSDKKCLHALLNGLEENCSPVYPNLQKLMSNSPPFCNHNDICFNYCTNAEKPLKE